MKREMERFDRRRPAPTGYDGLISVISVISLDLGGLISVISISAGSSAGRTGRSRRRLAPWSASRSIEPPTTTGGTEVGGTRPVTRCAQEAFDGIESRFALAVLDLEARRHSLERAGHAGSRGHQTRVTVLGDRRSRVGSDGRLRADAAARRRPSSSTACRLPRWCRRDAGTAHSRATLGDARTADGTDRAAQIRFGAQASTRVPASTERNVPPNLES